MEETEKLKVKKQNNSKEKPKTSIIKELIPYIIIIVAVLFIRTYIVTPIQVDGSSMYPTLDDKEILILKKYDKSLERFDVVVFNYKDSRLIKRVIGLPGETVEYKNDKLYINGVATAENFKKSSETLDFKLEDINYTTIPKDKYFVMGDNRNNSADSRMIGLIDKSQIKGTTNLCIFPFDKFGAINKK